MFLSMAFSGKLSLVYRVWMMFLISSGDDSIGTVKLMKVICWCGVWKLGCCLDVVEVRCRF